MIEHGQGMGGSKEDYWHVIPVTDTSMLALLTVEIKLSFEDITPLIAFSYKEINGTT